MKLRTYSPANRRAGMMGMFLGAIVLMPLGMFVATNVDASGIWTGVLAATPVWLLLSLILMLRKEPLSVSPSEIARKPSLWGAPQRIAVDPGGEVKLENRPDKEGSSVRVWSVSVVAHGAETLISEAPSGQFAMRNLAEGICKTARLPLADHSDPDQVVQLAPEDLDLPLADRLRKYKSLSVARTRMPAGSGIEEEMLVTGARAFTWSPLSRTFPRWILGFTAAFALIYFIPGEESGSFFDYHGWSGFLTYAIWLGLAAGSIIVLLWGTRVRLEVSPHYVSLGWTVLGMPLPRGRIPAQELEELRLPEGRTLQLISDRRILTMRTFHFNDADKGCAHWLAWEVQTTLAHRIEPATPA